MKTRLAVLLTALVISATVLGQATLGNMYKLGSSTHAALPASSATIQGALIYNLDAGAPYFNNGTVWAPIAAAGSFHWVDGGAPTYATTATGFIKPINRVTLGNAEDGGYMLLNGVWLGTDPVDYAQDGRPTEALAMFGAKGINWWQPSVTPFDRTTLWGRIETDAVATMHFRSRGDGVGGVYYFNNNAGSLNSMLAAGTYTANAQSGGFSGFAFVSNTGHKWHPGDGVNDYLVSDGTGLSTPSYWASTIAGGSVAFKSTVSGARWDYGAGTNDYAASDGTGIETPGYWESTRTISAGPGVTAPTIAATGSSAGNFTAATYTANTGGTLAFDTTFNQMMLRTAAGANQSYWQPIGQPHSVFGGQSFSTRIAEGSVGIYALAERVNVFTSTDGGVDPYYKTFLGRVGGSTAHLYAIGTYLSNNGAVLLVSWTNPIENSNAEYITTGINETVGALSPGTLTPIINSSAAPKWCQRFIPAADAFTVGSYRVWMGLTDTVPGGTTSNGNFAMFRWETAAGSVGDGLLYVCTKDNVTQTCTSTGITPVAATAYLLCLQLEQDTRNVYASIDGKFVLSKTTNLPTAATGLAPMAFGERLIHVNPVDGGVLSSTMGYGVMQVESR